MTLGESRHIRQRSDIVRHSQHLAWARKRKSDNFGSYKASTAVRGGFRVFFLDSCFDASQRSKFVLRGLKFQQVGNWIRGLLALQRFSKRTCEWCAPIHNQTIQDPPSFFKVSAGRCSSNLLSSLGNPCNVCLVFCKQRLDC